MDDGEVELSDQLHLSNPCSSNNIRGSTSSVGTLLDEFLRNNVSTTCTHTHTCNPPGPDATHTHTCYHTHTHVLPLPRDKTRTALMKTRRPSGNREAVRKYREKKKVHAAYLEEEVKKLRALNQQLVRRLQGQAILESEILRLKNLLFGIKGTIAKELGGFSFNKQCQATVSYSKGECDVGTGANIDDNLPSGTDIPCFHPSVRQTTAISEIQGTNKLMFSRQGNCTHANIDCEIDANGISSVADQSFTADTLVSSTSRAE